MQCLLSKPTSRRHSQCTGLACLYCFVCSSCDRKTLSLYLSHSLSPASSQSYSSVDLSPSLGRALGSHCVVHDSRCERLYSKCMLSLPLTLKQQTNKRKRIRCRSGGTSMQKLITFFSDSRLAHSFEPFLNAAHIAIDITSIHHGDY